MKRDLRGISVFLASSETTNSRAENLGAFKTDKESAVHNGILSECNGKIEHFLGSEDVKANVERKLDAFNFLDAFKRHILSDIVGRALTQKNRSLHETDCKTEEMFLDNVSK